MSNPDEIRARIEATRADLSDSVNELGDKVSPSHIARRQTARLRRGAVSVRDRVMGAAESTGDSVGGAVSQAGQAVADVPDKMAGQVRGTPIAAGLIAFGVGMVISALLPASQKEAQAAAAIKESAQPLIETATDTAKEVAGHLQEPAQEALEAVKSSASDAVDTVKDESRAAADSVKDQAQDAKDTVQQHAAQS